MELQNIHIGDNVRVHNIDDSVGLEKGYYFMNIVDEDRHNLILESSFEKVKRWKFYRDTGYSHSGDAIIDKIL